MQSGKDQYRSAQSHSPARRVDVGNRYPEVQYNSEYGNDASDLQEPPEAPVQKDKVFAIAELDVQECENFEDSTCCGNEEAYGYKAEKTLPNSSDTPLIVFVLDFYAQIY